MTWPCTLGCLGGKPGQARFLTGRLNESLSYLDPHYVQEEVEKQYLGQQLSRFVCKEYRLMDRQDLDPSLAFCFYLDSLSDLEYLVKSIEAQKVKILAVSAED